MTYKNTRTHDPLSAVAARLTAALDPETRARTEKIGRMNSGYIESNQHHRVAEGVAEIVENGAASFSGEVGKRRALFVLGESGTGKTTALKHTLLSHSALQSYIDEEGEEVRPLIYFEAPKPTSMKLFARKIIEAAGFPIRENGKYSEYELFEFAKRVLKQRRVMFLYVDEMQHLLRGNTSAEVVNVADTLKSLLQIDGWPLHLIIAGLPVLATFLEHETQLRNRSLVVSLEQVTYPADIERVRTITRGVIEKHAELTVADDLLSDQFTQRLIKSADGAFGTIIQMVRGACQVALRWADETVQLRHFAECYLLVTGCQPHHNIFLAADWEMLTPSTSLADLAAKQARADRVAKATQKNREA